MLRELAVTVVVAGLALFIIACVAAGTYVIVSQVMQ